MATESPDQAVTSSGTNAVSILLGTGDGNFQPAVNYPVGADPVAIVTGDFNHDGHLDLAVLNSNPNTGGAGGSVSILNGQSDGTFVAGATNAVGFIPTAIGVGDFDGDGNLDLAVVVSNPNLSLNPGFVTILLGSANGSFTAQGNYGVGLAPVSIAVGDFTGDGKLDLAVGSTAIGLNLNTQSEISILINNGSGGFQAGPSFVTGPTATIPVSIAVADFNDDARLDLAVAMNNTTNVLICQGNGDGTFSIVNAPGVGGSPIWVAAGDFNGDGKPDLMVANNGDSTVSVLLGNGDETFIKQRHVSRRNPSHQPGAGRLERRRQTRHCRSEQRRQQHPGLPGRRQWHLPLGELSRGRESHRDHQWRLQQGRIPRPCRLERGRHCQRFAGRWTRWIQDA